MAKLVRRAGPDATPRCGWVTAGGVEWIDTDAAASLEAGGPPSRGSEAALEGLLMPIDPPEVWAAGVTYERSRQARVKESELDVYSRVYHAARPELFFKDAACRRTVGPGAMIGVRSDGLWTVPEPELALVVGKGGRIVGATAANDVTARNIEAENPLYLPQAKIFACACSIGPAVLTHDEWPESFEITCRILDANGTVVWADETSTSSMKRTFEELVSWLVRDNPVPAGSVLLTGTGLVPPDDVALAPAQRVEISVTGIGTLVNTVGAAADLVLQPPATPDEQPP
jgi:2-dehydro-3-deoxy-D-arabinonate dehydratase